MCISIRIIMCASYDSIDNKQKMCEKINKDMTFIQFFHSTELFKLFFLLLTLQVTTAFLQKASWPATGKKLLIKFLTLDIKKTLSNIITILCNNYITQC